jgi:hypothetical protein
MKNNKAIVMPGAKIFFCHGILYPRKRSCCKSAILPGFILIKTSFFKKQGIISILSTGDLRISTETKNNLCQIGKSGA